MSEIEHELQCRRVGKDQPRAILDRHGPDCEATDERPCKGCQPCPRDHCVVDSKTHVTLAQTCPSCIDEARGHLADLIALYAQLPAHAILGGSDGRLEVARPIPGGEAMVMLAPGSTGGEVAWRTERGEDVTHKHDERRGEIEPTLMWVSRSVEDWRALKGQTIPFVSTLAGALVYLDQHLTWAAQEHPAFAGFAHELTRQVTHLEDVLHAGERDTTGAPCPKCRRPLVLDSGDTIDDDRWICKKHSCHQIPMDREEYARHTERAKLIADWLPAEDMTRIYRINRGTLQGWASKGRVKKRRDFHTGRKVYNVAQAVACRDAKERTEETA